MKSVLISGANKGIGFETARLMAEQGYQVFLGSRNRESGQHARQQLNALGLERIEIVELDITDDRRVDQARQAVEKLTDKLDVLINNAGIRGEVPQPASTFSVSQMKQIYETNLFGAIRVTQAFMPLLNRAELPVIVNVSSDLGSLTFRSNPDWKNYTLERAGYAPSKTALNAYTVALAAEFHDTHFKINCVDPGHSDTDFNNHMGKQPADQAAETVVRYAILDKQGPHGKFFDRDGEIPW